MNILLLVVSYHTTNFFKAIFKQLQTEGHRIKILALHELPVGAREDGFDAKRSNWAQFDFTYIEAFKPDRVIIFNGYFRPIHAASKVLRTMYPVFFAEVAWFPQNDFIYLDADIHHRSQIAINATYAHKDDPELRASKMHHLLALKEKYRPKDPGVDLPENFVLVPLQLERDTSILYASDLFKDMNAMVAYVRKGLPGIPLVVKTHPKAHTDETEYRQELWGADLIINDPKVSINNVTAKASMIVGINSTSMMEALIHEKPVVQFGSNIVGNSRQGHKNACLHELFWKYDPLTLKMTYDAIQEQTLKPNLDLIHTALLNMLANQIDHKHPPRWAIDKIIKYTMDPQTMKDLP